MATGGCGPAAIADCCSWLSSIMAVSFPASYPHHNPSGKSGISVFYQAPSHPLPIHGAIETLIIIQLLLQVPHHVAEHPVHVSRQGMLERGARDRIPAALTHFQSDAQR